MNKGKTISLVIIVFAMINFVSCIKNDTRKPAPVPTACSGTAGPKFTAVKNLVAANCVSCHNNIIANGGQNFTIECNIVANHSLIKFKAVDEYHFWIPTLEQPT